MFHFDAATWMIFLSCIRLVKKFDNVEKNIKKSYDYIYIENQILTKFKFLLKGFGD